MDGKTLYKTGLGFLLSAIFLCFPFDLVGLSGLRNIEPHQHTGLIIILMLVSGATGFFSLAHAVEKAPK